MAAPTQATPSSSSADNNEASTSSRTQRYRTEDVQSDAGSFADLLLPPPLVHALAAAGFVRPSPVQKAAIPIGRVGTDLIVQAKSGTGKTAVFATILLDRVDLQVSSPQAIVMAPTRELAIQSYQVIERVAAHLPQPAAAAAVFVGGLPTADDEKRLRRVCHIAVGTPGRLCGLITSGALLVGKIKAVVLDEADQLLNEAFYADTAWLLQQLPQRRQVLACSATYTPELLADLEPLMRRPQKVLLCEETVSLLGIRQFYRLVDTPTSSSTSSSSSGSTSAAANGASAIGAADSTPAASAPAAAAVQQQDHQAGSSEATGAADAGQQQQQPAAEQPPELQPQLSIAEQQQLLVLKVDALLQLLSTVSFHQAVVFCNRKPTAEWLARRLTAAGCPSAHLSSDLPQTERMSAMQAVLTFRVRIIVSTDVMARGVDFDRVNLVVNIDLPPDAATYVHRVGRTGRFGSRGIAVALVSAQELARLQQYLADVRGGDISPLPDTIPSDLYSFDLGSQWERDAYQQLLAAPTSTPPDSPPPLRKKKKQQAEQQQAAGGGAATAAELSAFGYDEAALSCFDWGEDDSGAAEASQQQQHESQGALATAGQAGAGDAAAAADAYDAAAAWEAWAAYYRSCGYDYQHANPYLTSDAAAAAAAGAAVAAAGQAGVDHHQQQQPASADTQLPQHQVLFEGEEEEVEDEEEEEDEWELPGEDEVDDRARMLLARLHVTQQAAALAAGGVQEQEQQHQHQQQQPQMVGPIGEAVCWQCWSAEYAAWQQNYAAWQQQYGAWCQQYQRQQHQQWQQCSSWIEAYNNQQQQQRPAPPASQNQLAASQSGSGTAHARPLMPPPPGPPPAHAHRPCNNLH